MPDGDDIGEDLDDDGVYDLYIPLTPLTPRPLYPPSLLYLF
jgi:hypothetical protein